LIKTKRIENAVVFSFGPLLDQYVESRTIISLTKFHLGFVLENKSKLNFTVTFCIKSKCLHCWQKWFIRYVWIKIHFYVVSNKCNCQIYCIISVGVCTFEQDDTIRILEIYLAINFLLVIGGEMNI